MESGAYLLFWELIRQLLEGIKRFARGFRVALSRILIRQHSDKVAIIIKIDQTTQIIDIIDIWMIGMEFDKALNRC